MSQVKCSEIELLLDAYHDGELFGEQFALVDEHLGQCPDCQRQLTEIKQVVSVLKDLPRLELSPDLEQKLDGLLEKKPQAVVLRPAFWTTVAASAAVCLLFFGVGALLKPNSSPKIAQTTPRVTLGPSPRPIANYLPMDVPAKSDGKSEVSVKTPAKSTNQLAAVAGIGKTKTAQAPDNRWEIASLLEEDRNTITESIGLATDEDGLYALKM